MCTQKSARIMSIQPDDFLRSEHTPVISSQVQAENIASTPGALPPPPPLFPFPVTTGTTPLLLPP